MAHASSIARHVKAAGILERQECTPVDDLPGLWHVTDSGTGSGRVHVTSSTRCDCPDHNYRGNVCKHITAVARTEAELAAYADAWDTAAATQRDGCPMCGQAVNVQQHYVGGRGYLFFRVCSGEGCRHARPA